VDQSAKVLPGKISNEFIPRNPVGGIICQHPISKDSASKFMILKYSLDGWAILPHVGRARNNQLEPGRLLDRQRGLPTLQDFANENGGLELGKRGCGPQDRPEFSSSS
jgi:hypothetical protein